MLTVVVFFLALFSTLDLVFSVVGSRDKEVIVKNFCRTAVWWIILGVAFFAR